MSGDCSPLPALNAANDPSPPPLDPQQAVLEKEEQKLSRQLKVLVNRERIQHSMVEEFRVATRKAQQRLLNRERAKSVVDSRKMKRKSMWHNRQEAIVVKHRMMKDKEVRKSQEFVEKFKQQIDCAIELNKLREISKEKLLYGRYQERCSQSASRHKDSEIEEKLRLFEMKQAEAKKRAEEMEMEKLRSVTVDKERVQSVSAHHKVILEKDKAAKLDKIIQKYKRINDRHQKEVQQSVQHSEVFHAKHLRSVDETRRRLNFVLSREQELKRRTEERLEYKLLSSKSILDAKSQISMGKSIENDKNIEGHIHKWSLLLKQHKEAIVEKLSLKEVAQTRRSESLNNTKVLIDMLRKKVHAELQKFPKVDLSVHTMHIPLTSVASPYINLRPEDIVGRFGKKHH